MSSPLPTVSGSLEDSKPNAMCLSPQDKLKGSVVSKTSVALNNQRKQSIKAAVPLAAMDFEMVDASSIDFEEGDLDEVDLLDQDDDQDMDDAGWISDDNLRALEFDERLNQEIDWVNHDDVDGSLLIKLELVREEEEQDFVFNPSSFLSPMRGSLSFDDDSNEVSSSFAASHLSVDTPPPSFGTRHDAEKLLMSFDTMNFTIPSPTSGSNKKRAGLFGKNDSDAADNKETKTTTSANGSMSPSLKTKAAAGANGETDKDASLPKLSIPAAAASTEPLLGVLSLTTPTASSAVDPQKKIGSYSPEARRLRIQKFHEKRKNRTWKKSIKYDCRKKLADDRPRIKGRFVRVLENVCDSIIKEEETCSTTSTAVSSPRSVSLESPSPSPATMLAAAVAASVATPAISAPTITPVMQVVASALAAATSSLSKPAPVVADAATPTVVAVPTAATH